MKDNKYWKIEQGGKYLSYTFALCVDNRDGMLSERRMSYSIVLSCNITVCNVLKY